MRSTLRCLVAAAGAGLVAGTSAKWVSAGIPRGPSHQGGAPTAFDGLGDTLKSGGVDGLMAALSSMAVSQPKQDNVVRDENGNLMYDFVHTTGPPTTAPAPPETTLPLLVAAQAAMAKAVQITGHQPAAPPRKMPMKPAASTFMAPTVPVAAAPPALPAAPPVPIAAAAPAAPAVPQAGASGGALGILAARLAALRQQVDSLSAQADAAARGAPMAPAAGVVAPPPQIVAPQVPPQLEAELQEVLHRVTALEDDNKKLHEQVDSQSVSIAKTEGALKADELQLGQVKRESDNITALIHRKHHKKAAKAL